MLNNKIAKWLLEQGFVDNQAFFYNLPPAELIELAIKGGEGKFSETGALIVDTTPYTGRSPNDKYIVDHQDPQIWLGEGTKLIDSDKFDNLKRKVVHYLSDKKIFIKDVFVGAHPDHRLPIRVITEKSWQSLFADNLFITKTEDLDPSQIYTLIVADGFEADPQNDQIRSKAFIIIDLKKKVVLIGGTKYAGEIKKSVFTLMNYIFPQIGILSLHCSANIGENDDVALFFGLSGTGKTTLSSDQTRTLIGDDEHGWSSDGIFNIEGGCYAKTIHLDPNLEPLIWQAVHQFGALLENVPFSSGRTADFESGEITENTRAAYPLTFIENYLHEGYAGHPSTIFLLTADAFGVLPPLAKLSIDQALFYFINGYTSKLAGTERGIVAPQATFSPCFGAPFLPLHPFVYAKLLRERLEKHQTSVWLLNTGWIGGPYGIGNRINLPYTRAMIQAVLGHQVDEQRLVHDRFFGLEIPSIVPGVPSDILFPEKQWKNKDLYALKAKDLMSKFIDNYAQYSE